jgi:antimicrobial peptide system SdpA family protein
MLLNTVRENPISIKHGISNKAVSILFPQGWSFFTKDPREASLCLYDLKKNRSKINFKNTQSKNLFGLIKSDRLTYYKIFGNITHIPVNHFFSQPENIETLDISCLNTYSINNTGYHKGTYLAEIKELQPWIWYSTLDNVKMPARYILTNIKS